MRNRLHVLLRLVFVLIFVPGVALAVPDLALSVDGPTEAVAGTSVVYGLAIDNVGTTPSSDGVLQDILPAGVTLINDSLGICSVVATAADHQQTVNCILPAIAVGQQLYLSINALVEHDFLTDGRLNTVNDAIVIAGTVTGETNFANNAGSSGPMLVRAEADLTVHAFTQADGPIPVGEQFSYVIIAENLGPSTATNINIVDTLVTSAFVRANGCSLAVRTEGGFIDEFNCNFALATGVFDLAAMGSQWLNPRGATCDWDPAANPGEEIDCDSNSSDRDAGRVLITIDLTAVEEVGMETYVTVTSDTPDPDLSNNQATAIGSFFAVADLEIQKVAGPPTAPGATASWNITAINHGPSAAANVLVLDTLPGGLVDGTVTITGNVVLDILGAGMTGPAISCSTGTPGNALDPAVCDLGGLPSGWGATLVVSGLVEPGFTSSIGGIPVGLTNDVEIRSETVDAVFANNGNCAGNDPCPPSPDEPNFASATVAVGAVADIVIALSDAPDPVIAGEALSYQAVVSNNGPSAAQDVIFSLELPDGVEYVSAWSLEGRAVACVHVVATNTVMCELFDLDLGGAAQRTVVVNATVQGTVPNGAVLTATASATSATTPEGAPLDNVGVEETTTVGEVADVYIDFVDVPGLPELDQPFEPDLAVQGWEHRFAVTFGNAGPSIARDVALQFFLDFVSFGTPGETFVRCEPFDIDDFVACSSANNVVDVDLLLHSNQQIVPGDIEPGREYGFWVITRVIPDYLDQHLMTGGTDSCQDFGFAEPCSTTDSRITTATTDLATFNNVDAEDARILDALDIPSDSADVSVEIATDKANAMPGETFTYEMSVMNWGYAAANGVVLRVWLPEEVELQQLILGSEPMVCDETPDTGSFACDLFAFAADGARTVSAEVQIDPATPLDAVLRSTAHVQATSPDANVVNNQTTHDFVVGPIFSDGFESGSPGEWTLAAP